MYYTYCYNNSNNNICCCCCCSQYYCCCWCYCYCYYCYCCDYCCDCCGDRGSFYCNMNSMNMYVYIHAHGCPHTHTHTQAFRIFDCARATTLRPMRPWMLKRATGRTNSQGFLHAKPSTLQVPTPQGFILDVPPHQFRLLFGNQDQVMSDRVRKSQVPDRPSARKWSPCSGGHGERLAWRPRKEPCNG